MSKKNNKKKKKNNLPTFNLNSAKMKLIGACIVALASSPVWKDKAMEIAGMRPTQNIAAERPAVAGSGATANHVPTPTNVTKSVSIAADRPAVVSKASTEALKTTDGRTVRYEMPETRRGEVLIEHTGYMLSYDKTTNCPKWVAWELTDAEATATGGRSDIFLPDPKIEAKYRVTTDDYKGSGYDRGHMCPSADMKWSSDAQRECFYMTNICPQLHTLNAGGWSRLETACRRWAKQEGCVYVACGPIYNDDRKVRTIGTDHIVRVPDAFFKVVLSLKQGDEKSIGFIFANSDKNQTLESTMMTVDEVEAITGYNFFNQVNRNIENRVEAKMNLRAWN